MSSELLLYVIGYNHSSWSMRAGLALRQTGAAFREIDVRDPAQDFAALKALSPSGLFPALRHGEEWIWDSLSIAEYLAEEFPKAGLWPEDKAARAHARSMVAEMHSSFFALREHLPMNIQASYPGFYKNPQALREIERISQMWEHCLVRFGGGGPFLFGSFTLADAFYAPVVMRFTSYDVELLPPLSTYMAAVRAQPFVQDWIAKAMEDRYVNPKYHFGR